MKQLKHLILFLILITFSTTARSWCVFTENSKWASNGQLHLVPEQNGLLDASSVFIHADKSHILNAPSQQVQLTVGATFNNYSFYAHQTARWACYYATQYTIKWTIYYALSGSSTLVPLTSITKAYECGDQRAPLGADGYSFEQNNHWLSVVDVLSVDLKETGVANGEVTLYVQPTVRVKSYSLSASSGNDCIPEEYFTDHTCDPVSRIQRNGVTPCVCEIINNQEQFVFNLSDNNTTYNTGNGTHVLVYNDPRSEITFVLTGSTDNNLPASKLLTNTSGQEGKLCDGKVALFASSSSNVFGDGNVVASEWDEVFKNSWLQTTGLAYSSLQSSAYAYPRGLVRNTGGLVPEWESSGTLPNYYREAIVNIPTGETKYIRKLSDFASINGVMASGEVIYVSMKAFYGNVEVFRDPYVGGFSQFLLGNTSTIYLSNTTPRNYSSGTSRFQSIPAVNTESFEIVPTVSLPALSSDEKAEKRICITDTIVTDKDYIYLPGKSLVVEGAYSESMYSPEYIWQYSFSPQDEGWSNLSSTSYTFDSSTLPFAVTAQPNDVFVKNAILKGHTRVYFRQICVLNSFCSDESTNGSVFYSYPKMVGEDRVKYYLMIESPDYYTYSAVPSTVSMGNFGFIPYNQSKEITICVNGESMFEQYPIAFGLQPDDNLYDEAFEQVSAVAKYEIRSDDGKFSMAQNRGSINFFGDTIVYHCTISVCNVNFTEDITLKPSYQPIIDIRGKAQAVGNRTVVGDVGIHGGFLAARDTVTPPYTIYVTAERGKEVSVRMTDTENTIGALFAKRKDIPFVAPEVETVDFDGMSRRELITFCEEKNWVQVFADQMGQALEDDDTSTILRFCKAQFQLEQNRAWDEALNVWRKSNKWDTIPAVQNNCTVSLQAYADTLDNVVFYLRKSNGHGCISDSVRVEILYTDPIVNNRIYLSNNNTEGIISSDDFNPVIYGSLPTGGFGTPDENEGTVYTFAWYYKSANPDKNFGWQLLPGIDPTQVSTSTAYNLSTTGVYLPKGLLSANGHNLLLRRVVTSQKYGSVGALVSDTSNVITLRVLTPIQPSLFSIPKAVCSGESVQLKPANGVVGYEGVTFQVVDDDAIVMDTLSTRYGGHNFAATFHGATRTFHVDVQCYMHDNGVRVTSNTLRLEIPMKHLTASFDVLWNGQAYSSNELLQVPSGSRIRLMNHSESEDGISSFHWNLEEQTYEGQTLLGTTSLLEHPACYLYNVGENKLSLTVTGQNQCTQTVAARIQVVGSGALRRSSFFVEPEALPSLLTNQSIVRVYPTQVDDVLSIETNVDAYTVRVLDSLGRTVVNTPVLSGFSTLHLAHLPAGLYLVTLLDQTYKIIKR